VTSRGNAREDICLDDTDRAMFLGVLVEVISNVGWVKRSEPTINVGRDADSIFPKDLIKETSGACQAGMQHLSEMAVQQVGGLPCPLPFSSLTLSHR
jgi:hypothetical protein